MHLNITNILLAAAVLLTSCSITEIKYGAAPNPGDPEISVTLDWSGIQGSQPQSMYVIGSRFPNNLSYGYIYPEMSFLEGPMVQSKVWANGEYDILCVSPREDLIIKNQESLSDLCVSLPVYTSEASDSVRYVGDAGEIFAGHIVQTITSDPSSRNITISPKNMNQELTVIFNTQISEDVTINSITATLSGVAYEVFPFSGGVNYKDLCSIVLPVEKAEENRYQAKVNILGLFPPEKADLTSGPGILQLTISTTSHLGSRTFNAGINLSETIAKAAPMTENEEFSCYNISGPSCTLEIANTLIISTEAVDNGLKDGVDAWFNMENIDILL